MVTITALERTRIFDHTQFTTDCIDQLRDQAAEQSIAVLAYCFMPDHLHLLLSVEGNTGIIDFIGKFKSATTRLSWKRANNNRLWQRSFHDHLLRDREDESEYLRYILTNPVRAGLVDEWIQYPFGGSFVYDLSDGSL